MPPLASWSGERMLLLLFIAAASRTSSVAYTIYVYSVAAVSAADNNHTHLFDYEQRRRAPSKFSVNCEATKGETSSTAVHLKHFMIFVIMEHKCTEVCAIIRYFHIYLWLRLLRAYCHSEWNFT